jgi:hypothetical protein
MSGICHRQAVFLSIGRWTALCCHDPPATKNRLPIPSTVRAVSLAVVRAGFGDTRPLLALGAGVFAWRQTKEGLHSVCTGEATDVVDRRDEAHARYGTHSRHGHEPLADRILLGQLLELLVGSCDLLVEHLDANQ